MYLFGHDLSIGSEEKKDYFLWVLWIWWPRQFLKVAAMMYLFGHDLYIGSEDRIKKMFL